MRRKLIGAVLVVAVLAAAAAGVVAILASAASRGAQAVDTTQEAERIPNVKVRVLESSTLQDVLALTGMVEPWQDVTMGAEVGGRIRQKNVEEGDTVTVGQVLFSLDTEALEARLKELEAQMGFAEQEFQRLRRMAREGIGTRQDLERAETQRSVSQAGLESIRIQLAKSVVKSPFEGVVARVHKEKDEFVDMGAPLVRLVQVDRVKVVVGIPERDIAHFELGAPVEVVLDALEGRTFRGTIHRIAPTAEISTRTFPTEVAVDNADGILRPGMIARVRLVRRTFPDSVTVPVFAVVSLEEGRFVFVEEDGLAHLRPVEVGVFIGEDVQVTRGLEAGDRVIVVGQRDLREGAPVAVQEVERQ